jgi:hypothetical protein
MILLAAPWAIVTDSVFECEPNLAGRLLMPTGSDMFDAAAWRDEGSSESQKLRAGDYCWHLARSVWVYRSRPSGLGWRNVTTVLGTTVVIFIMVTGGLLLMWKRVRARVTERRVDSAPRRAR